MNTQLEKLNQIPAIIDNVISEVKSGSIPALPIYIKSKTVLKQFDRLDKEIKNDALEEASRYSEKNGVIDGVAWEYKNGSGRYNYSCDEEWCSYDEQIKKLMQLKKEREEKMKLAYKTDGELVIDGEIIPKPKFTPYSDSISVK